MRARVYNKSKKEYYISEIFAVTNLGYVVDDPDDRTKVLLVDYIDPMQVFPYTPNIEVIDNEKDNENWVCPDYLQRQSINKRILNGDELTSFRGSESIWSSDSGLLELIANKTADKEILGIKEKDTKLSGWNYIENDDDIEKILDEYSGFHDAVIKEMSYISGDYFVKEDKFMKLTESGSKQIRIIFDSEWGGELELILLSPRIVHLIPGEENKWSDIIDVSIFIKDCRVYFYTSVLEEIPEEFNETYFVSMGMRWRLI